MKKRTLKKQNRYELLEIMLNLRKENDELRTRCETAEAQVAKLEEEVEQRKAEQGSMSALNDRLRALERQLTGQNGNNPGAENESLLPDPAFGKVVEEAI